MKRHRTLFALLSLLASSGMVSSCATLVEEIEGPVVESSLTDNTTLVTVSGRKNATQQFLVIKPYIPEQIRASVILFAGGTGHLGFDDSGSIRNLSGNFLVKTRNYFVQQGMIVAVVDTPSDRRALDNFRTSWAHAVDIRAVITWLRKTADVPLWLVGTSRGTISVAGVAGHLASAGPDGIVLTSTVFESSTRRGVVYDANLDAIQVPVLVVHHKNDGCAVTPYSKASAFMQRISAASKSELITIEGGAGNLGNPCEAKSPHGFLGLEYKVVTLITDWIKAN